MRFLMKTVCLCCGAFYCLVGALLFCVPSFFFYRIAPIGTYNQHYSIDLGSFLLPVGVFLIWTAQKQAWIQPVLGIAALGSLLHLISHLRYGVHSFITFAADMFFALVAGLLLTALWADRRQSARSAVESIPRDKSRDCFAEVDRK